MFADEEVLSVAQASNRDRLAAYRAKVRAVPITIDADITLTEIDEGLAVVGMAMVSDSGGLRIVKVRNLMKQAG